MTPQLLRSWRHKKLLICFRSLDERYRSHTRFTDQWNIEKNWTDKTKTSKVGLIIECSSKLAYRPTMTGHTILRFHQTIEKHFICMHYNKRDVNLVERKNDKIMQGKLILKYNFGNWPPILFSSFVCVLCSWRTFKNFNVYCTAGGAVPCGGRKRLPVHHLQCKLYFFFRSASIFWEIRKFDRFRLLF